MPRILGVVGLQDAGKTTLIQNMVAHFKQRNLNAAVIKHDGHLKIDERDRWEKGGSDTERYVDAGASYTMIAGGGRSLLRTAVDTASADIETLCRRVLTLADLNEASLDVILVEGFKKSSLPKIAVLRRESDVKWLQEEGARNISAVMCSSWLQKLVNLDVKMYDETQVSELCDDVIQGHLT